MDPRPTRSWHRSSTSDHAPPPLDLRLALPALAAWAGAAAGVTGGRIAGLGLGVGFIALAVGLRRRAWTVAGVAAALLGACMVATGWVLVLQSSTPAVWARAGALVEVRAKVSSDARLWAASPTRPEAGVLSVMITQVTAHGQGWSGRLPAELRASGEATELLDQPVGAEITFLALAREPKSGDRSVATLALRNDVQVVSEPGFFAALANRFRAGLRDAMAHSPPQQAGLVPSLVVGDVTAMPEQVKDDFVTTGLTHLTAVSGTNLTLMLAFSLGLARRLGVRGWWLRGSGVLVAIAFIVVCRAEPSVLRAAAMGLVALAATGLARDRARGLRALGLAVLVLVLIDPWLAKSWGFALSVCASAGILWWGSPWQTTLRGWMPGWLAESLAIPLAAQLATQPLVTILSGEVSAVGVAANVAAGPFVGPVTILGLAAALVSLVSPPVAAALGWLAGWCAQPILLIAQFGAAAPAASWRWPPTPVGVVVLAAACLLIAQIVLPRVLPRRWASLLLAALLVAGAFRQPPQPGWPGDWAVIACDVGQGGAQLIRAGPHAAVLVDTGPDPKALSSCLRSAGVRDISLLVITHPHSDHIGGLPAIAGRMPVGMVLTGPEAAGASANPGWAAGLPAPVGTRPGDVVQVAAVRWTTLAAGSVAGGLPTEGPDNAQENDAGVVGRLEVGGLRVLVTGDLEVAGQQALLTSGADLRADVLVVPHHGSPRQDEAFLTAVGAKVALIQVGEDNDYGHPAASTLRMLSTSAAAVFRTDQQGALAVTADGQRVIAQR